MQNGLSSFPLFIPLFFLIYILSGRCKVELDIIRTSADSQCICVYMYMYIYIYTYLYTYVCIHIYILIYVYACIYIYIHVYICTCVYVFTSMQGWGDEDTMSTKENVNGGHFSLNMHMYICIHILTSACIYVHKYTLHVYIFIYLHV